MPLGVTYRSRSSNDTMEIRFTEGMILPKVYDQIVSPFHPDRFVAVLDIAVDAPRNCYQVTLDE